MKGKQLAILLALVVVLGGAGYILQEDNQSAWSSSGGGVGSKVLDFPINDVAQVRLAAAGSDVNLVKKNEEWTVQDRADYPANFEQVSNLLRELWDLKIVQEVGKVGPSQMSRFDLVEPGKGEHSGTLVELKDKDGKNVSALLIGKNYVRKSEAAMMDMSGFPAGRYVTPVGSGRVSLISETLSEVEPKPERWLKKDFLKVEQPKSISVAGQTEPMRWTLNRDGAMAEWKLADAKPEEQLDTSKVNSFATLFSNPTFKDVLAPDAKPEETGLDKPTTVTIETFDNFTYTLKIGKLTNDAYPVTVSVAANIAKERTPGKDEKPEDKTRLDEEFTKKQKSLEDKLAAEKKFEGRPYLVEKNTVEPLLKERTALLVEKKPEPATTSITPAPNNTAPTAATAPVSVTTPPLNVTTPPVSVTTPPVSVPPATAPAAPPQPVTPTPAPATPPPPPPAEPTPAPAPSPSPADAPAPAATPAPPAPAPAQPAQAPEQSTPAPAPSSPAPQPQPDAPSTAPAPAASPAPSAPAAPAPAPASAASAAPAAPETPSPSTPTPAPAQPTAEPAQSAPSAAPSNPAPQQPQPEAPATAPAPAASPAAESETPAAPARPPSAEPAPAPAPAEAASDKNPN